MDNEVKIVKPKVENYRTSVVVYEYFVPKTQIVMPRYDSAIMAERALYPIVVREKVL